nr:hypothetical protein [Lachnospiraceae bacterium]
MRLKHVKGSTEKIERHVNTIQADSANASDYAGKWNSLIFKNNNPIHIEIGMGKGQFILEMAKQNPEINFIGIEKFSSVLVRAIEKLEAYKADENPADENTIDKNSSNENKADENTTNENKANENTVPHPYKNIIFLRMDAEDIDKYFAEKEVSRIYLNFSDPWPKKRHEKRRLT